MIDDERAPGLKGKVIGEVVAGLRGPYVKVTYTGANAKDVTMFQVVETKFFVRSTNGKEAYLEFNVGIDGDPETLEYKMVHRVGGGCDLDAPTQISMKDWRKGPWRYYTSNPSKDWTGKTGDSVWIADRPTMVEGMLSILNRQLDNNGVTYANVTSRFTTYLEYKGRIVGHVAWRAESSWTSAYPSNWISNLSLSIDEASAKTGYTTTDQNELSVEVSAGRRADTPNDIGAMIRERLAN